MKNIFRNIKPKLILAFSFILIVPAIIIGSLSYTTAKNAVEQEILDGFSGTIDLLNTSIDDTIQTKRHDIDVLSKRISSNQYQGDSSPGIRQLLDQYISLHPEADSVFVGTDEGLFIQEPKRKMDPDYDPRERYWYEEAMKNKGEVIVSNPSKSASTGDLVVTIMSTTQDGSGVVAVNIDLNYIQKLVKQVKIGDEGYAFLLDNEKKYIAHPKIEAGSEGKEKFYNKMYEQEKGKFTYEFEGAKKIMAFSTNQLTGWKIAGGIKQSEISDAASPILKKTMLVIVIALLVGAFLVFIIIKSIIRPLKVLKEKAITVSKGDLTEHIQVQSNDEIGQLAMAFNEMQESLKILVREVEQSAERVAASAEELTASAEHTAEATEQVSAAIQEVASSAEKQTTGVDHNSRIIADVSEGMSLITDYSIEVSKLAHHTTTQAEAGGQAVTNTVNQMNSIHKSVMESNTMIKSLYERSKEVSSILNVITGIADQTNLLALNAAIEAARAGEYGKGFSVVADEVRKLAEQSQTSAREIHDIVQGIQNDTETSVKVMALVTSDVQAGVEISNEAIEKFNQILKSTKEITPQMDEISSTAQQMNAAVQEVTSTTDELAEIAQVNAANSEEVAASTEEQLASMEEISASAKSLSFMAEELNKLISKFKH
ncbi:methyl-accepting chemotaxis protein [Cytobacillus sp. FJAT-53684]|uniref:Methyl-accepting chemotaxis protein n=1 Tax=Cytobacillus mangrovibacter TaxID=3299024 RepID=A0ABW6K0L8_9BACI